MSQQKSAPSIGLIDHNQMACTHVMMRGKRRGETCDAKPVSDGACFCRLHTKHTHVTDDPQETTVNLFYDVLPLELQDYVRRMQYIPTILDTSNKLKPFAILENFRTTHFNRLNRLYNPNSKPYTDKQLLKHWCDCVSKGVPRGLSTMIDDLEDVEYVHCDSKHAVNHDLCSRVIQDTMTSLTQKQSVHVNGANDFITSLYEFTGCSEASTSTFDDTDRKSDPFRDLYELSIDDLKSMYDQSTLLCSTYNQIIQSINDSNLHKITMSLIVDHIDIVMFRQVLSVIERGAVICRKCCTWECNNITKSMYPHCKMCRESLSNIGISLKKPFDIDALSM